MAKQRDRIRWSPRIQPRLINRLYESDAAGFIDDELCNEVGFRLYLRCQTIVMVSQDEVPCPRCGSVITINTATKETITVCPTEACGWETTRIAYQQSWSKKRIWGKNALPAFEDFYQRFSPTLKYQEKMFLIDRLIHRFHWSLQDNQPARSAANNLIEGSHDQVIDFLDKLTGGDSERKAAWRTTKDIMMQRRKGK